MSKYDTVTEKIPRIKKRISDQYIGGSNNTAIIFGRDRKSTVESGYGNKEQSGAMYVVAGRKSEDYDFENDKSFLYLSMKSDPDEYAGTTQNGNDKESASAILKSDHIRVVGRNKVKIVVGASSITLNSDGTVVIDGRIKLGAAAVEKALKGDSFVAAFMTHSHLQVPPAPGAVTGPPITPIPPNVYSTKTLIE